MQQMPLVWDFSRIYNDRYPKRGFYLALQRGKLQIRKPKICFRNIVENNIRALKVNFED